MSKIVEAIPKILAAPNTAWEKTIEYPILKFSKDVNDFTKHAFYMNVREVSAAHTADTERIILADATGGAFTITLPLLAKSAEISYWIMKTDLSGNVVTIDGAGSEPINGATTLALSSQFDKAFIVRGNISNWYNFA